MSLSIIFPGMHESIRVLNRATSKGLQTVLMKQHGGLTIIVPLIRAVQIYDIFSGNTSPNNYVNIDLETNLEYYARRN